MRDLDMIGTPALEFFTKYRVDYAVFSCGGLVMDSTKNGLDLPFQMGHAWDFDMIVTGASFSASIVDSCSRHGCRIIEV